MASIYQNQTRHAVKRAPVTIRSAWASSRCSQSCINPSAMTRCASARRHALHERPDPARSHCAGSRTGITITTDTMATTKDTPPDQDAAIAALALVTDEDISEFFNTHQPHGHCPYCASKEWAVLRPNRDGIVTLPLVPLGLTGAVIVGSSMPTIPMVCTNCGHVRLQAGVTLGRWKLDKDKKHG